MSIKIFHHNDIDGRCSAAIVRHFLRDNISESEFVFISMDYKDPFPFNIIEKNDVICIVDFSFKPDVMAKLLEITPPFNIIWCDHHKTAKDYNYNLPGYCDFSEDGLAGCECTYKYFAPDSKIPKFIQLIGDYDAWRLQLQPDCFEFYEGLKLEDTNPKSSLWEGLFSVDISNLIINKLIEDGKTAIRYRDSYRDSYCETILKTFGHEISLNGIKGFAANLYGFGSKGFAAKFNEYDFVASYIHAGKEYTVSLYSDKIDVGELAKKYGGGGHKGAAGFVCSTLPWATTNFYW